MPPIFVDKRVSLSRHMRDGRIYMKYRALPIGISDFAEMIQKEFYYVDKTPMIQELLDSKAKVTLFTRPRRFGKTLNSITLRTTGTGMETGGTGLTFLMG